MAGAFNSLVVKLALDAAEFVTGLEKSDREAQRFSKRIDSHFAGIGRAIASIGVGAIITKFTKDTIAAASALDDLADATGSSVENLSQLANIAKISGTSFETLQGLVLKLGAGMAGADDESSNVGRALKALGVTARDPVEALNQMAVALNKYGDGIGKLALLRDAFGKEGPRFAAAMKDIANAQDVAATVTTRQAQEAENLEKAIRKLTLEGLQPLRDSILGEVVPAMSRLIEQLSEGTKIAGGFFNAMRLFATLPAIGNVQSAVEEIAAITTRIGKIEAGEGLEGFTARAFGRTQQIIDDLKKQRAFIELQLRQIVEGTTGKKGGTADDLTIKPLLNYTGAKEKQAAKGVDEFKRALESAQKASAGLRAELDALNSGEEKLSQSQRALAVLQADNVWKTFNETQREQIRLIYDSGTAYEKEIDAIRRRREEYEKSLKALHDQAEAETKLREAIRGKVADYALVNDTMRRQLAILGQEQVVHERLAAATEYEKLVKEARNAKDLASLVNLEKEYQIRLQLIDAMDKQNKALEEQRKSKEFVDALAQSFASAAEEAIAFGRSAKDVIKGLEQDLLRIITRRLVTQPLEAALGSLFGGMGVGNIGAGAATSAGGFWGWLMGQFGGGIGYGTAGSQMANLGPYPYANGTSYHPGGMALVGERGPELINLPRGAQVIPAERLVEKRDARVTNIVINNLPGATKQSAMQAAEAMTRQQLRASRNG